VAAGANLLADIDVPVTAPKPSPPKPRTGTIHPIGR